MTDSVLFYRPVSKRGVAIAFTAAAIVHLSAIAIASLYHEPIFTPEPLVTWVDVQDLLPADPLPPPPEIPEPSVAPPVSFPEFVEPAAPVARPPVKRQVFLPNGAGSQATPSAANPKGFALSAPRPDYPYEARSRHITGSGVAILTVDPATGLVVEASMAQSVGNAILDNSALSAFRRWRFRPGTVSKVKVPITFNLMGAHY